LTLKLGAILADLRSIESERADRRRVRTCVVGRHRSRHQEKPMFKTLRTVFAPVAFPLAIASIAVAALAFIPHAGLFVAPGVAALLGVWAHRLVIRVASAAPAVLPARFWVTGGVAFVALAQGGGVIARLAGNLGQPEAKQVAALAGLVAALVCSALVAGRAKNCEPALPAR
jgi:hypothetical protein